MQPAKKSRRDEQFCSVVISFMKAKASFDEQLADYRANGKMDFPRLDAFVEDTLFTLKEDCHFLFRKGKHEACDEVSEQGLFDISVGSIFHELMKIKENVYQLSYYAPLYSAMLRSTERDNCPSYERAFLEACDKIVRRARRTLPTDLKAAEELFRDAADNLRIMLHSHADNPLLPRMLIENKDLTTKVFNINHVDDLLKYLNDDKLDEVYLIAARDYLEGGWYEKAHNMAKKVLEIDPDNLEARQINAKLAGKLTEPREKSQV